MNNLNEGLQARQADAHSSTIDTGISSGREV
jgi:hypothetical protein